MYARRTTRDLLEPLRSAVRESEGALKEGRAGPGRNP